MAQYLILIYESEESYAAATPEDFQNVMDAHNRFPAWKPLSRSVPVKAESERLRLPWPSLRRTERSDRSG